MSASTLNLKILGAGRPGLSPSFGAALAEAGGVCFESQGHSCGIEISVYGTREGSYSVYWPTVTPQIERTYTDEEVATEHGAVGIAILLAESFTGQKTLERSRKGTGFDWWLGEDSELPLQGKTRLEVSGIRNGQKNTIKTRVAQKLKQIKPSDETGLPAFVIVVEFSLPAVEVSEK